MQPLFVITLGARTPFRTRAGAAGMFTTADLTTIEKIVRKERGFQGFSIAKQTGFWNGNPEDSVEIKIICDDLSKIKACAQQLRGTFRQESILVTAQGCGTFLKKE
jgi:hypothetical protein